ncbi:family 78 glycoside hydrolase catalytic domain [Oceanobacillus sp. FSL W7-1293]|uniref:family 78 glycoside hydrolase catalytic domain n=1 Tax=Oceanobacillus sp. FSL W7-1293 TaxID=2921699 RepID=UPI0030CB5FEB
MLRVTSLRCEYLENPLGLDVKHPRMNWKLISDQRNVKQQAYFIEVALDEIFQSIEWSSGKVLSDQSVHIPLNQINLQPFTRYYYRVKVWDDSNQESEWSNTAYWETGMLDASNWQAKWICASNQRKIKDNPEACHYLRKEFHVNRPIKKARAYASALGLYELQLNGNRIGDFYFTPGWTSYQERIQYQAYDITTLIKEGRNAIGFILGNGWYKGYFGFEGRTNIYGDKKAAILEIHITYEDGTKTVITSDDSWKATTGPIQMSEIYFGEYYDAREEIDNWSKAALDDKTWVPTKHLSYDKYKLIDQRNEPVRKVEYIKPKKIIQTPNGETVLDMGQNMVGWMHCQLKGNKGQKITLHHAEILDKDGNFYVGNLRKATQEITYICKGDPEGEMFEPRFSFQGFQYVRLTGFLNDINIEDFTGVVLHSDMSTTGSFESSNELINQLHRNINWGLKGNFLDVPTDCPQRDERLGWTGDAQMFFRTSAYLRNVAPFFTKWLKDLEADQLDNGGVPYVVPNIIQKTSGNLGGVTHSVAAWGDAAVIIPWSMYLSYGDKRILDVQYQSMKNWVEYIRNQGTKEELWDRGFQLGDWLGLDSEPDTYSGATDKTLIATAYFAYSTDLLRKTAEVLNKEEDAKTYRILRDKIKSAYQSLFILESGNLTVETQTAHVLTLMFELASENQMEKVAANLVELIKKENYHLTTGFIGAPYLNIVLSKHGYHDVACRLLLQTDYPSWLYQVTKGATTVWEHWDSIKEDGSFWSDDMNSFNHYAYGSIGEWLYKVLAGIDSTADKPGYKHILLEPRTGANLDWVSASVETMYGSVKSEWKISEKDMQYNVNIPANASATIVLRDISPLQVTERNKQLSDIEGLYQFYRNHTDTVIKLGSGNYSFQII